MTGCEIVNGKFRYVNWHPMHTSDVLRIVAHYASGLASEDEKLSKSEGWHWCGKNALNLDGRSLSKEGCVGMALSFTM